MDDRTQRQRSAWTKGRVRPESAVILATRGMIRMVYSRTLEIPVLVVTRVIPRILTGYGFAVPAACHC